MGMVNYQTAEDGRNIVLVIPTHLPAPNSPIHQ